MILDRLETPADRASADGMVDLALSRLEAGDVVGGIRAWRVARGVASPALATAAEPVFERVLGSGPYPGLPHERPDVGPSDDVWAALWAADTEQAVRLLRRGRLDDASTLGAMGVAELLGGRAWSAVELLRRAVERGAGVGLRLHHMHALTRVGRHREADALISELGDGDSFGSRVVRWLVDARMSAGNPTFGRRARRWLDSESAANGLFSVELPALMGRRAVESAVTSPEKLARFLELVLGVLAGNLGAPGTRAIVDDTGRRRFVPLSLPLSARVESVGALNSLRHLGPQQAEASLSDLIQRRPRAAQALCYRGELYLWQGRYDEAWRDFVAANRIEPLRWANIGLFAVLVMTGQFHRAQAFGVYADNRNTAISGGTLPVYRGVLRRRLGDMKGAVEALTPAVEAKPSRIGARMELALALRALGRSIEAQAHVDVVVQEGAAILISAADALGLSFLDEPAVLTSDGVFEEALASMRGNRSSLLVTWFDVHGGLRVLRSRLNWKGPARSVRSEWRRDGKAG